MPNRARVPRGWYVVKQGLVRRGDRILEVNGRWLQAIDESQGLNVREFSKVARHASKRSGK